MSKLTRESKAALIEGRIRLYENSQQSIEGCAISILDAIDPPEIKPTIYGRFEDVEDKKGAFSYVPLADHIESEKGCMYKDAEGWWKYFTPFPGLKEAIEKLEAGGE